MYKKIISSVIIVFFLISFFSLVFAGSNESEDDKEDKDDKDEIEDKDDKDEIEDKDDKDEVEDKDDKDEVEDKDDKDEVEDKDDKDEVEDKDDKDEVEDKDDKDEVEDKDDKDEVEDKDDKDEEEDKDDKDEVEEKDDKDEVEDKDDKDEVEDKDDKDEKKAAKKFIDEDAETFVLKEEKLEDKGRDRALIILTKKLQEKPNKGLETAIFNLEKERPVNAEKKELITHVGINKNGESKEFYELKETYVMPEDGDLDIIIEIPKEDVADASELVLPDNTEIIENDPVIKYNFNNLEAGEVVSTSTFSDKPIANSNSIAGVSSHTVIWGFSLTTIIFVFIIILGIIAIIIFTKKQ